MSEPQSQRFRIHRADHLPRHPEYRTFARRRGTNGRIAWVLAFLACSIPFQECLADPTVTGGMDPTNGYFYSWTITNTNALPIVAVEIPHYRGLVFTIPRGWSKVVTEVPCGSEEVDLGMFRITAPPGGGIRRGRSEVFEIQLHARGASAQRGEVRLVFSDGTFVTIANVEYPGIEPWLTRNMTLVGMIGLVLVALVVHLIRTRRAKRQPPPATQDATLPPPSE